MYFLASEKQTPPAAKMEKQNKFSRHSSPLLTRRVAALREEDEKRVQMLESQHRSMLY